MMSIAAMIEATDKGADRTPFAIREAMRIIRRSLRLVFITAASRPARLSGRCRPASTEDRPRHPGAPPLDNQLGAAPLPIREQPITLFPATTCGLSVGAVWIDRQSAARPQ
jgi:hypothetical protein